MTYDQLVAGLAKLNAPDQGMRYHSGGQIDGPRFDEVTGAPLPPRYKDAELTVHGERARFLYALIDNAPAILTTLERQAAEIERLREALGQLHRDCLANDFNELWDSYTEAKAALTGEGS